VDHPAPADDRSVRRLDDGREFEIVKVYYRPDELAAALEEAGFHDVEVTTTGRFFVLATAVR
jgi:demethylmenaquinone methyltransferase/2-methoxy-6-polyprenyl-1,4-benzoquinol methylase